MSPVSAALRRPEARGGSSAEWNLALACVSCSLRKGARQKVVDPETGRPAEIFNPRDESWTDHFHRSLTQGLCTSVRTRFGYFQRLRTEV